MNKFLALSTAALFCVAASVTHAQQAFKTPDEAAAALASAAKASDMKALTTVLGPDGEDIVSSGDEVADAATRQKFVAAYDVKHQIKMDDDNKATMIIGNDDFPVPIPIVRKNGQWKFDTDAGREEILFRRIGKNELDAIQSSLAYVDAQNEYSEKDRTGAGVKTYAQRIISQQGKKDGLYWPSAQGQEESPLGELVAQATSQGYRVGGGRTPFHEQFRQPLCCICGRSCCAMAGGIRWRHASQKVAALQERGRATRFRHRPHSLADASGADHWIYFRNGR